MPKPDAKQLHAISKWFPSKHGGVRGMGEVQRKLASMDCIIEVHDARVPLSGRNSKFLEQLRAARPHLLVYNKSDLIPRQTVPYVRKHVVETEAKSTRPLHSPPMFASAIRNHKIEKIVPRTVKMIEEFFKDNLDFEKKDHSIMVVGVPNVGKSSIINAVRESCTGLKNMATPIGAKPGVTRHVLQKIRVNEHPKVYIVDTPGVLEATPVNYENALRLALCGCTIDDVVGYELMAAYLLNFLQTRGIHSYVSYMGLTKPTDDLRELLETCTKMLHHKRKVRNIQTGIGYSSALSITEAAQYFIRCFRAQRFGKILLDDESLPDFISCWELKEEKDNVEDENSAFSSH